MLKFKPKSLSKILVIASVLCIAMPVYAIEDAPQKKSFLSFFKKDKNEVVLEKTKKKKRTEVSEITLPEVSKTGRPSRNVFVMSIDDCVTYAIAHNPNLQVSEQRIVAAQSGVGKQNAN